jgi:hypothetical protein
MNQERHRPNGDAGPIGVDPERLPLVDAGRRRLFRGVGGGAGVLLAVSAKSALGSGGVCQSPSAAMSGNTSPRPPGSTCSGGLSPGYWKVPQHSTSWPLAGGIYPTFNITVVTCAAQINDISLANMTNPGTTLGSVFPGLKSALQSVSMWYVLYKPKDTMFGTQGQLLRHLSCAWLNAGYFHSSAAQYPITKAQVIEMWNAVKAGGTYCPSSIPNCPSPWSAAQVIAYIEGMYDINSPIDTPVCKQS